MRGYLLAAALRVSVICWVLLLVLLCCACEVSSVVGSRFLAEFFFVFVPVVSYYLK
jgi:hypothetical protein